MNLIKGKWKNGFLCLLQELPLNSLCNELSFSSFSGFGSGLDLFQKAELLGAIKIVKYKYSVAKDNFILEINGMEECQIYFFFRSRSRDLEQDDV